jgi:hypothetical protein
VCAVGLQSTPYAREWAILGVLALVASRFPLRIPGNNAWFSISDTFFMASALLFGQGPATIVVAIDSMAMTWAFRTNRVRRLLFNSGAPAIAFWVGAQTFYILSGVQPLFGTQAEADSLVLPIASFALIYFGLNSGLTALAIALEKGSSPIAVWRSHFVMVSLNYFASGSVAFILVLLTQYLSIIALMAVIPLLAVLNLAMRSWTGTPRGRRATRRHRRPSLSLDDRRALDRDRSEGRRDQQPHSSRAALRRWAWPQRSAGSTSRR